MTLASIQKLALKKGFTLETTIYQHRFKLGTNHIIVDNKDKLVFFYGEKAHKVKEVLLQKVSCSSSKK